MNKRRNRPVGQGFLLQLFRRALAVLAGTVLAVVGMALRLHHRPLQDTGRRLGGYMERKPQAAGSPVEFKGQTIRQIVRVSIGGK